MSSSASGGSTSLTSGGSTSSASGGSTSFASRGSTSFASGGSTSSSSSGSMSSSSSGSTSLAFTSSAEVEDKENGYENEELYRARLEEGYDIYDPDYVEWLNMFHPEVTPPEPLESSLMSHFQDVEPACEIYHSSPVSPPSRSILVLEKPPSSSTLVLETPPSSSTLVLETPPSSSTLVLETPPSSSTLVITKQLNHDCQICYYKNFTGNNNFLRAMTSRIQVKVGMASSSSDSGRTLREKSRVNYRDLVHIKLPREKRGRSDHPRDQLFPVSVLERRDSQVKIHYEGYTSIHDEWRDVGELELLNECEAQQEGTVEEASLTPLQPYSLYKELRIKIKQGLTCGRKSSPIVRIVMPFDLIQFNGGLKECGFLSRTFRGIQRYTVRHYRDLDKLLDKNWHYRGLNINGDYGYAVQDTIEFKSRSMTEYVPSTAADSSPQPQSIDTGYSLVFSFICRCGTPSTFGKNSDVFFS